MQKSCFFLFFLLQINIARSQSTLKVVSNCSDAIVLLDTTHIPLDKLIKVPVKNSVLKCWAPNHELTIDTLKIVGDTLLYLTKQLKFTERYLVYKNEYDIYTKYKLATSVYTLSSLIGHFILKSSMNGAYDNAIVSKEAYENSVSPEIIDENRRNYEDEKDRYEILRTADNALIVLSAGLIIFGVYETIHHNKKVKQLKFNETPLLVQVDFGFNSFNLKQPMAKVVWKF